MATPTPTDITTPITPARFAAALKDLSIASLHLKVLEIRNALLHLAHSNAQLQPFADGTETSLNLAPGEPDPDCVEAIRENEIVIERMRERIELVKAEVVARGLSWSEFEEVTNELVEDNEPGVVARVGGSGSQGATEETGSRPLTNGLDGTRADDDGEEGESVNATASSSIRGNPWTDGTFQVGTIRNGELHMDSEPPRRNGTGANSSSAASAAAAAATTTRTQPAAASGGGRLTDEELRRLLEVRLAEDANDEEDGGLHL
ncbi:hypothetical protein N0V82_000512 [Gnomoniopsis sp. IMI 355080]|nr:hypothetical protein N0V82_000512 [Gnomoniopsis sp. IMI 355080]